MIEIDPYDQWIEWNMLIDEINRNPWRNMTNIKYILKGHEAVPTDDLMEWAKWFEIADRIVKQKTLPNGKMISTVFLGLDHNFGGGKPLLFETMVFNSDEIAEEDMDRYSTWEEAEIGHKRMVKKWSKL